jgi:hypothetical protein
MPFFGKYRGTVENNIDPDGLGRLQVSAPAVLGIGVLSWALPCVPYAGEGVGFWAIPPIGANIWVEFEGGNLDYPIWSGCFWVEDEAPPAADGLPEVKVFQTNSVILTLDDTPGGGGITLSVMPPAVTTPMSISLGADGISIQNQPASITLNEIGILLTTGEPSIQISDVNVDINDGALQVI